MYVEYTSTNSGGSWWLTDEDWRALEAAGWVVAWQSLENLYDQKGQYVRDPNGLPRLVPVGAGNSKFGSLSKPNEDGEYRFLGALAVRAYRLGLSMRDAAEEWEQLTGKTATDPGCACCGQPHTFIEYDDTGRYVSSGPSISYEASW